jgi:hypothetical protein
MYKQGSGGKPKTYVTLSLADYSGEMSGDLGIPGSQLSTNGLQLESGT